MPTAAGAAVLLAMLAVLHVFWGFGGRWPAANESDLVRTVVGSRDGSQMPVDFLVVDIAQTAAGDWIVIELNEAQESGYAGVPRLPLWRAIISEGHL